MDIAPNVLFALRAHGCELPSDVVVFPNYRVLQRENDCSGRPSTFIAATHRRHVALPRRMSEGWRPWLQRLSIQTGAELTRTAIPCVLDQNLYVQSHDRHIIVLRDRPAFADHSIDD